MFGLHWIDLALLANPTLLRSRRSGDVGVPLAASGDYLYCLNSKGERIKLDGTEVSL